MVDLLVGLGAHWWMGVGLVLGKQSEEIQFTRPGGAWFIALAASGALSAPPFVTVHAACTPKPPPVAASRPIAGTGRDHPSGGAKQPCLR